MKLLFKHLLAVRHMAYVTLDSALQVVEISDHAQQFADMTYPLQVKAVFDLSFPELIGMEADLQAVIQGERSYFSLHAIARPQAKGGLLYFDLYAIDLNRSPDFPGSSVILLLEDVTERMTLEQKLVQASNEMSLLLNVLTASENYLDRIIASMADALIVTTPSGQIKTVNSAAKTLFGYGEEELINQPFAKLVADENFLFQIIQPDLQADQEALQEFEMVCQTKTGEKRSIAFSGSGIFSEAELQNCIYIGRDVTERRRTQQRFMAQYTTARVLSDVPDLHHAAINLLPALCQGLNWDLVELWMPAEFGLQCVETWARPALRLRTFITFTQQISFLPNEGLPGRVWATGAPQWMNDVSSDDQFVRSSLTAQAGLHAAFGFPIQSGEEVLGVITFFCREVKPPDLGLLQTMVVIGNQLGQFIKRKQAEAALRQEQERTEQLLLNVLPASIVAQLKQEQGTIAEHFANVSVLFADLVNFSQLASSLSPIALVNLLNQVFSAFDRLTERYGLEKIKTIGDAYMVVGGLPPHRTNHVEAIAAMALEMQAELACLNTIHRQSLSMRIGIHTGPVVAGVIGLKKFAYDLWGETVNIASRLESHGAAGRIQVSEAVYQHLRDCKASSRDRFGFEKRGCICVKGQGELLTYWLCDLLR